MGLLGVMGLPPSNGAMGCAGGQPLAVGLWGVRRAVTW